MNILPPLARLLAVSLILLGASCSTLPMYYVPREHLSAESISGDPAAGYELKARDGELLGEVRVWSTGSRYVEVGDGHDTVLTLGVEVESHADRQATFQLDAVRAQEVRGEAERDLIAEPRLREVSPGTTVMEFDVVVPPPARPRDVRAFRVEWSLDFGQDTRFVQFTPFAADFSRDRWRWRGYGYGYGFGWSQFGPYGGFRPGFWGGGAWGGPWCW